MNLIARRRTELLLASTVVLVLGGSLAACERSSDTDEQIAELEQELADAEAALEASEAENETLQDELSSTQTELADTQEQLSGTQAQLDETTTELAQTQAELTDAQAQLAEVGELVLADGTYVGEVLGAKSSPYPVIIFDAGGVWRVSQVADGATITAGGDSYTLQQFGKLLDSTDPDDIELVNGNYQVIVKKGLATSIRKSKA
jgi:multidrug efflux pump subunit AcrA (membrane-fusion protein)